MKNKKTLSIIGGLLLIIGITIIFTSHYHFRKNNNNHGSNPKDGYELVDNDYIKSYFIDSYEEYVKFMEDEEISKSDYYKAYNEKDFDGKKYVFVVVPIDSCSETIEKDKLQKINDEYIVYLDVAYSCGGCAPIKQVFGYEVEKELDVKVYSKAISREECDPNVAYKPIIYIYPEEEMDLTIKLGKEEDLLYTYPKYNNEWHVLVSPDGNIYDYKTNRNYYGLYWEGYSNYEFNMNKGFVVKGTDTVKFLEEKLAILGLNDYEINEFIIYWIDKLENNNYNFISFRTLEEIEEDMPLYISSEPDTLIRVMMDYKPLDDYIEVEEQELVPVERQGYTVVEWGGSKH